MNGRTYHDRLERVEKQLRQRRSRAAAERDNAEPRLLRVARRLEALLADLRLDRRRGRVARDHEERLAAIERAHRHDIDDQRRES